MYVLAVGDALFPGFGHERAQDRLARRVPREAGTPEGLGAEVALVEGAVLGQGEWAPPIPKLEDALGRLSRQGLDGPGVVDEVLVRPRGTSGDCRSCHKSIQPVWPPGREAVNEVSGCL